MLRCAVVIFRQDGLAREGECVSVLVDIRAGGEDLDLGQGEWGEVVNEEEKVEK